jgi:hypothetical protein
MAFIALKQARTHFILECLDLHAQGGLSDMQLECRTTKTQFLRNRVEILELPQLHNSVCLSPKGANMYWIIL